MTKVITFSRTFPAYHSKAGQPTFFVEKFWESIYLLHSDWPALSGLKEIAPDIFFHGFYSPKHHTIRAGHRFKIGDMFSPRVWGTDINPKSGRSGPYHSKQIIIGPDTEVKKEWKFEITPVNGVIITPAKSGLQMEQIAANDGLSLSDFIGWFKGFRQPGIYQIICWNENINY